MGCFAATALSELSCATSAGNVGRSLACFDLTGDRQRRGLFNQFGGDPRLSSRRDGSIKLRPPWIDSTRRHRQAHGVAAVDGAFDVEAAPGADASGVVAAVDGVAEGVEVAAGLGDAEAEAAGAGEGDRVAWTGVAGPAVTEALPALGDAYGAMIGVVESGVSDGAGAVAAGLEPVGDSAGGEALAVACAAGEGVGAATDASADAPFAGAGDSDTPDGEAAGDRITAVGDGVAVAGVADEVAVGVVDDVAIGVAADGAPEEDGVADGVRDPIGVTVGAGVAVEVALAVGDGGWTRFRFGLCDGATDGFSGDAAAAAAAAGAGCMTVRGAASVPGIEVSPIVDAGFGISTAPGCALSGSAGCIDVSPGAAAGGSSFGATDSGPAGASADGAGFSSSEDIGMVVASSARCAPVSTVPGDASAGTSITCRDGVPTAGGSSPPVGEDVSGDAAPFSKTIALAVTWYWTSGPALCSWICRMKTASAPNSHAFWSIKPVTSAAFGTVPESLNVPSSR